MMNNDAHENFSLEEWETCLKVLTFLKENPTQNPDNKIFSGLITKIYKKPLYTTKIDNSLK